VPHALKGRMPRLFRDGRCTDNRRLREVYEDLAEQFGLASGLARRLAASVARAWLDYEAVTRDLEMPHKPLALRRLRRQQRAALGQFNAGLQQLADLMTRRRARPADPLAGVRRAIAEANGQ